MHTVMLHSVTAIHQKDYLEQEDCITSVYFLSYPLYFGKCKKILTQDYAAADLCIRRKKGLLYFCCYYYY